MKTKKKMKIHSVNGFGITKGVENEESNLQSERKKVWTTCSLRG